MIVEWTITVGNLLTIFGVFFTAFAAFFAMRADLRVLKAEVHALSMAVDKISDILITLARQHERIDNLSHRVEELRNGKGFIFDIGETLAHRQVQPNARR